MAGSSPQSWGPVKLYSRKGFDLTARFPEIADCVLKDVAADNVILDGEIVFIGEDGLPSFDAFRMKNRRVSLYVFDVLWLEGDRTASPLEERRSLISIAMLIQSETLRISESFNDGLALFNAVEIMGLEGIVSKHRRSAYKSGRSKAWLKIKTKAWVERYRERWREFR